MSNTKTIERLLVGKINGLFGVKGLVKVFSYSNPREKIVNYKKWLIKTESDFQAINIYGRKQGKTIIAQIEGIHTPELAKKFLGKDIYINTEWLPVIEGEYYYYQLEGLQVFNTKNQDLGIIKYLFNTGSNTVIASKNNNKEYLIPFITPYLIKVDLIKQTIIVDWDKDF